MALSDFKKNCVLYFLVFLACSNRPKQVYGFQVAGTFINDIYSRLRRMLLLLLFIIVDTGQAFVTDWAEQRTTSGAPKDGKR